MSGQPIPVKTPYLPTRNNQSPPALWSQLPPNTRRQIAQRWVRVVQRIRRASQGVRDES